MDSHVDSGDEESSDETELSQSPSEKILRYSRNGLGDKILKLFSSSDDIKSLINCKGTSKANRDWTPLHLSCYFGHTDTVQLLIQNGAEVNAMNDKGDTPLHKAAHTGRLDLVQLLLKMGADVNIVNVEGKTPLLASKGQDIRQLIQAAQETENNLVEQKFLQHASTGNIDGLEHLIKNHKGLNINCLDSHGNSALHLAAYRDQQQMAAFLMQAGVRSDIENHNGQLAEDVASSQAIKQVLSLPPLRDLRKTVTRFEGVLYKKSRLFGFKSKYVVLDKGTLTIYNSRAEATRGHRRRVSKYLDDAQCMVQSRDNLGVALVYNNGSIHLFRVEPGDADSNNDSISRQRWVNAIRIHIEYSTYYLHKGLGSTDSGEFGELLPLSSMNNALETAQAHQASLEKEVTLLTTLAGTLHTQISSRGNQDLVTRCNNIATSSRDMCNVLQHCLTLFTQQDQLRSEQLTEEREKCRVLQESLRFLAVQHHELEQHIETSGGYTSPSTVLTDSSMDDSEDEFFDCDVTDDTDTNGYQSGEELTPSTAVTDLSVVEAVQQSHTIGRLKPLNLNHSLISQSLSQETNTSLVSVSVSKMAGLSSTEYTFTQSELAQRQAVARTSRSELPVQMLSRNEFSVWSILKQCIGKELSKITMPVVFNEPLSFLQRITEYMEYSYLLDRANLCETPEERMAYVSAFAVSACASNWERLGKPFNPLLGETYELNKDELNYKVVCEQVSHHPPVSAFHVTSRSYNISGAINPKLKFWGKSVEVCPKGVVTVQLLRHGEAYTWENVNCSIHNIIVGKLWVEHHGRMEVVNHKTGHRADISFKKSNMFTRDVHKIEGYITDRSNNKLLMLYGSWTDALFSVDVKQWELHSKQDKNKNKPNLDMFKSAGRSPNGSSSTQPAVVQRSSEFDMKIPGQIFLWQADQRPADCDKYYSFTRYAMMLNQLEESEKSKLCPTDSRLRPDIRSLELGHIDEAAEQKVHLEEKQRATRKEMKKNREEWSPRWFKMADHPFTGKPDWVYQGHYWDRDFTRSPDIF